ncbi:amidohydrolase family protein [Chitinophaga flava]|uniref:adenosine deaminase n=1 Tax=Chitinophaga flava TaxID=2259036 RepID=A0A365XU45_9BACT|nr:adenosine deaminase [Chitinophaga flava]RBL89897.1 adenosine deaminase [Chitinophaga flava]
MAKMIFQYNYVRAGLLVTACLLAIMAFTAVPQKNPVTRQVNDYFEQIRRNPQLLTAFFTAMPKGGDLHHHYSGSVYGETYWEILSDNNGWINTTSLETDTPGAVHQAPWKRLAELQNDSRLDSVKQAFLRKVSIKDYDPSIGPPDQHFFATFGKMGTVASFRMEVGLRELKQRALKENVQYIETMLGQVDTVVSLPDGANWEKSLTAASLKDSLAVFNTLNKLHTALISAGVATAAKGYCHRLAEMHNKAHPDDSSFMIRYQLSIRRSLSPLQVYRRLLLAFQVASQDTLVVGVNLVTREDGDVSMRDYSLHMLMFADLSRRYPGVKYALHAGELAMGMVRPEQLRSHITEAVMTAGAKRIGHGVTIAYESDWKMVLHRMSAQKIPVEINLSSNEFILKVKNEEHPVLLYHSHKVPIVIGTDDAGVLRTDLTRQYVLLAARYPSLRYTDIKEMIRNSIIYSFIQPAASKEQQLRKLDTALLKFEEQVLAYRQHQHNR